MRNIYLQRVCSAGVMPDAVISACSPTVGVQVLPMYAEAPEDIATALASAVIAELCDTYKRR